MQEPDGAIQPPQPEIETIGLPEQPARTLIEIPPLTEEKASFQEAIIGQDEAVDTFAILLARLKSGIRPTSPQPFDAKFLGGPSGVGKTEIVYRLAEVLSGGAKDARSKVIKLNGGEYQQEHTIGRVLGAPPGYIGSEDPRWPGGTPPLFSQENLDSHKISYIDKNGKQRDVVLILVDEAEKANIALHRAFLSILDKGNLDLANNKSADFKNAVIFYTSNEGNEQVEQMHSQDGEVPQPEEVIAVYEEAFKNAFPPELRGRIREIVVFNHLNPEALERIVNLKVKDIEQEFLANGVPFTLELSDEARKWILERGYNRSEGARALDKVITDAVKTPLTLAQTGVGLLGRTVYADFEENSEGLQFYLPETATQLPSNLSSEAYIRLARTFGAKDTWESMKEYVAERRKLIEEGVIASPEIANKDPNIQNIMVSSINYRINNLDFDALNFFVILTANAGLVDKEILSRPEVKEAAQKRIKQIVERDEAVVLEDCMNLFILAGLGTAKDWGKSTGKPALGIFGDWSGIDPSGRSFER